MSSNNIDSRLAMNLTYDTDPELELLGGDAFNGSFGVDSASQGLDNAPIFTGDVLDIAGPQSFPQRGLYGCVMAISAGTKVNFQKLYINTNTPFSGIVCGVQGSGKSHSTSVLLESCLISDKRLGNLPAPLSALLFHYDAAAGSGEPLPCEAAWVASLDPARAGSAVSPEVTVLVLPNSLRTMRKVYAKIPEVKVEPLHFSSEDISASRLLAMMKVDQGQHLPLYMESVMSILRSLDDEFCYDSFCAKLKEEKFSTTQKAMLELRLNILDTCLEGGNALNRVSTHFGKGRLTIIDLSSPFMDGGSACGFFDIILGLFIEKKIEVSGKLVVLDEAHKYLTKYDSSSRLTDSLLSVIRQQRHLATRVLISTQEPTVVPSTFLDLCSFVIAHRFSSLRWVDHLKQHFSTTDTEWYSKVITLRTGEAIVFSPTGLITTNASISETRGSAEVLPLGRGYLHVRSRERITRDGGRSLLATDIPAIPTTPNHGPGSRKSGTPPTTEPRKHPTAMQTIAESSHSVRVRDSFSAAPSPSSLVSDVGRGRIPPTLLPPTTNATPLPNIRFQGLLSLLETKAKEGQRKLFFTEVGTELKKSSPTPYVGKLRNYLNDAMQENLVIVGGYGNRQCVRYVPEEFRPLVAILRKQLEEGDRRPRRSIVATQLYSAYPSALNGPFESYAQRAEAEGVIICDLNQDRMQLAGI